MDYYQGVVTEYLRADRAIFLNTECCIQLNAGANPDTTGPHWFCDAVAVDFRAEVVFLCEVSYARGLGALLRRLSEWNREWSKVRAAVVRDCSLPARWPVRPWLFIPEECVSSAIAGIQGLRGVDGVAPLPIPRITTLEMIAPWKYRSWDRAGEKEKPNVIPEGMRV